MTENPTKFIKLLRSLISETKGTAVTWTRHVHRNADGGFDTPLSRGRWIAEDNPKFRYETPLQRSALQGSPCAARGTMTPKSFMIVVHPGLWSEKQVEDFARMMPDGCENGNKAKMVTAGGSKPRVIICCDEQTAVYKLLIDEGILNLCREILLRPAP